MTRIVALSAANTTVSDKVMNTQTRSAHYRATDFMKPEELEITNALEASPTGFEDILDVGALNFS